MYTKITVVLLVVLLLLPLAIEASNLNPIKDVENPTNLNIEVKEYTQGARKGKYYFTIKWKNPDKVVDIARNDKDYKIEYQIDYKVGNNPWLSQDPSKTLPTYDLTFTNKDTFHKSFDPIETKISKEDINIEKHNYSFRIRYKYGIHGESIYGDFSSPVSIGVRLKYVNASSWAILYLEKAEKHGFIAKWVDKNARAAITREEFIEILVKVYEKQTGEIVEYKDGVFTDTNNSEVLKAVKLGITNGVGYNQFAPNAEITRQEIAVAIKRTLDLLYPNEKSNTQGKINFKDEKQIAPWARDSIRHINYLGIMQGDDLGNFNPRNNTTREEGVVSVIRLWEK